MESSKATLKRLNENPDYLKPMFQLEESVQIS